MIPADLRQELMDVINEGDEAKAREFIVQNLTRFPQDVQDAVITAFFHEALVKKNQEDTLRADFQKEGLEALETLDSLDKKLDASG